MSDWKEELQAERDFYQKAKKQVIPQRQQYPHERVRVRIDQILTNLSCSVQDTVLDGIGDAMEYKYIHPLTNLMYGIDISLVPLPRKKHLPGLSSVVADSYTLPFAGNSFDFVMARGNGSIAHLSIKPDALKVTVHIPLSRFHSYFAQASHLLIFKWLLRDFTVYRDCYLRYLTPKSPLHAMERGLSRPLWNCPYPLSTLWRGGRG